MTSMATGGSAPDTGVRSRLRALEFWVGHHRADQPVPHIGPPPEAARDPRSQRIEDLVAMIPQLKQLGRHSRASVRVTVAKCFSILAMAGRAPADREVWRMLLGLAKYDDDSAVREAADAALADLERFGTVASRWARAS